MDLFGTDITTLPFAGTAGDLCATGNIPALIIELGDNYGEYHRQLADRMARTGRPDSPTDALSARTADGWVAHAAQWHRVERLVIAEAVLRVCTAHRAQGTPVEARLPDSTPLVRNDQLVDFQAQTEPSE